MTHRCAVERQEGAHLQSHGGGTPAGVKIPGVSLIFLWKVSGWVGLTMAISKIVTYTNLPSPPTCKSEPCAKNAFPRLKRKPQRGT